MRGPGTTPMSIARLSPNVGPPRSRTVVIPRRSVRCASAPATRKVKPGSAPSSCAFVRVLRPMCTWASMSPGMSVRPRPSMIVVVALRSTAIGAAEMRSITAPRTSTFVGAESALPVPSKTRTLVKSVTRGGAADGACAVTGGTATTAARQATNERNDGMRVTSPGGSDGRGTAPVGARRTVWRSCTWPGTAGASHPHRIDHHVVMQLELRARVVDAIIALLRGRDARRDRARDGHGDDRSTQHRAAAHRPSGSRMHARTLRPARTRWQASRKHHHATGTN